MVTVSIENLLKQRSCILNKSYVKFNQRFEKIPWWMMLGKDCILHISENIIERVHEILENFLSETFQGANVIEYSMNH